MLDIKAVIVAVLMLIVGCILTALLVRAWYGDWLFYIDAQQQPVYIRQVIITQNVLGDPVHAATSFEVEVALTVDLPNKTTQSVESYSSFSNRQAADSYVARMRALEKSQVNLYLSAEQPRRFAEQKRFPWTRLLTLMGVVLLFIFPSLLAIRWFMKMRKVKNA